MKHKIYVIAGSYSEAQLFIHKKCTEMYDAGDTSVYLSDFVIVTSPERLRGLTSCHGYFIGTYDQLPNIGEIKQQIHIINSRNSNA